MPQDRDGTLITQRFHFAPMPHPYKHVLGWYRLLRELRESDVRAICVFDGEQRSTAKSDEVCPCFVVSVSVIHAIKIERRRQIRRMDYARGLIEMDRLQRLQNLTQLLKTCRSLDSAERERSAEALRDLIPKPEAAATTPPSPSHLAAGLASLDLSAEAGNVPSTSTDADPLDHFDRSEIQEILLQNILVPPFVQELSSVTDNDITAPLPMEADPILETPVSKTELLVLGTPVSKDDVEDLPSSFAALYLNYRQSISKLDGLSIPTLSVIRQGIQSDDTGEIHTEFVMSKSQYQLTLEEGKFWESLAESPVTEMCHETLEANITTITEKSSLMVDSYIRRRNIPTEETYEESREILQAMGVPCIVSTGPFEAEALASSLVQHGLADYVASEDTDVLVYEAPLIRNITSRKEPLTLIFGADVRQSLQLDRASYVDFVLLLGTDFSQRIKNVGPQRALKFIREYGTIEHILEKETQYPPRQPLDTYLEQVQIARAVFETLPPVPEARLMQQGECDDKLVWDILQKFGLTRLVAYEDWDSTVALEGNYFSDNPSAS
ncbi:hypothetical protein EW146_g327 [Bondarzewia mesenterica]|uniref:XPG-I domain-containing protein n=1 Tax=Bondarzewia mesenterica TaxID=1095465 RepID=A0A4S4M786_9AGAM|nr:hypothetical protein EW146_g327 [Bondarzewia mesenterica]